MFMGLCLLHNKYHKLGSECYLYLLVAICVGNNTKLVPFLLTVVDLKQPTCKH